MILPESNHVFWIIAVIGLLIFADTMTSWLLYQNGYEVGKDSSKTMILVMTVLIPILLQKWQSK
jgi:hypothetical protein